MRAAIEAVQYGFNMLLGIVKLFILYWAKQTHFHTPMQRNTKVSEVGFKWSFGSNDGECCDVNLWSGHESRSDDDDFIFFDGHPEEDFPVEPLKTGNPIKEDGLTIFLDFQSSGC